MANKRQRSPGNGITAVRRSPVHGSGLFALRDIAAGQHIGVYEGRRFSPDAEREWDPRLVYAFRLSDGTVVDGSEGGNESRHINHSCEPNCAAYEVEHEDGSLAIVIETLRFVQRGEELSLDYALDVDQADERDFPCRCGAATCRGTMVAA
jgi:SET domain-containing protein